MEVCKICGSSEYKVAYEGPIRVGKFGNLSGVSYTIKQCLSCMAASLPNLIGDHKAYYESPSYRDEVDGVITDAEYFSLHDGEQLRHLEITGTAVFRDKVVADIGCGAGSFLDAVSGHARESFGVEPSALFRNSLQKRGYSSYPYVADALSEKANKVDVVVCFSVLEHIEDPLSFLRETLKLLSPGGKIILSTPNADDILLSVLPDLYPQFFYRKAHLWYFNRSSLQKILELAGYSKIKIIPCHRFGLSNFLLWLRDRTPNGNARLGGITGILNAVWKCELERTNKCDYFYAEAYR